MTKDRTDNSEIINFFKDHPFQSAAVIVSSTIFLTSFIGFFREYLLLKSFGINIVTYAEINDFLVAGLKDPYVLGIFPLIIIIFSYLFYFQKKRKIFRSKFSIFTIAIAILYPIGIAFMYIPFYSVDNKLSSIKTTKYSLNVKLRDNTILKHVSLISTTEKFIFLWSEKEEETIVLTIANVISITHKSKK